MSRFAVAFTPLAGLVSIQRQPLGDERGFLARLFCFPAWKAKQGGCWDQNEQHFYQFDVKEAPHGNVA